MSAANTKRGLAIATAGVIAGLVIGTLTTADATPATVNLNAGDGVTCSGAMISDTRMNLQCDIQVQTPSPTASPSSTTTPSASSSPTSPTSSPTATPSGQPSSTSTPPVTTTPASTSTAPPSPSTSPSPPPNVPTHASVTANAGPAPFVVLKPLTGQLQSGTAGAPKIYDGYTIPSGSLQGDLSVHNVILRNCVLASGTVFAGNDVTVDHCTIHGGVSLSGGDRFVFTNNNVTGWDDAVHITSDSGPVKIVSVTGNWLHSPSPACADHSDGVQLLGVENATFRYNVIDLGPWIHCSATNPDEGPLNGAFQVETTQGPVNNVTIDNNWLNGGGYVLRVYSGCTNIKITNNQFGRDARWGPFDTADAGSGVTTFSGNKYEDNGQTIARDQ